MRIHTQMNEKRYYNLVTAVQFNYRRPSDFPTLTSPGRKLCSELTRFQTWSNVVLETTLCPSCCLTYWNNSRCVRNRWQATWKRSDFCFHASSSSPIQLCWKFLVRPAIHTQYRYIGTARCSWTLITLLAALPVSFVIGLVEESKQYRNGEVEWSIWIVIQVVRPMRCLSTFVFTALCVSCIFICRHTCWVFSTIQKQSSLMTKPMIKFCQFRRKKEKLFHWKNLSWPRLVNDAAELFTTVVWTTKCIIISNGQPRDQTVTLCHLSSEARTLNRPP